MESYRWLGKCWIFCGEASRDLNWMAKHLGGLAMGSVVLQERGPVVGP